MLWNLNRQEICRAVLKIAKQRGLELKKIYSLTSGLWVSAELTNGHIVNFYDYQIQEAI